MKLRDFENRFEETLKLNKLEYTVEQRTEDLAGIKFHYKTFKIPVRLSFESPILITLTKTQRPVRFRSVGKSTASCFVVHNGKLERGLRNVWSTIKVYALPL